MDLWFMELSTSAEFKFMYFSASLCSDLVQVTEGKESMCVFKCAVNALRVPLVW